MHLRTSLRRLKQIDFHNSLKIVVSLLFQKFSTIRRYRWMCQQSLSEWSDLHRRHQHVHLQLRGWLHRTPMPDRYVSTPSRNKKAICRNWVRTYVGYAIHWWWIDNPSDILDLQLYGWYHVTPMSDMWTAMKLLSWPRIIHFFWGRGIWSINQTVTLGRDWLDACSQHLVPFGFYSWLLYITTQCCWSVSLWLESIHKFTSMQLQLTLFLNSMEKLKNDPGATCW